MSPLPTAAHIFCALLATSGSSLAAEGSPRVVSTPQALLRAPAANFHSAETSRQLSLLVELEGNREVRVESGEADIRTALWQRGATRFAVLYGAQRRIGIFDDQIASFDPSIPLYQNRVPECESLSAETLPAQVAADVFRVERERAKTGLATACRDLEILTGESSPRFGEAAGRQANVGPPPPFKAVVQAIAAYRQLMRWTAVSAQRNAEFIITRLKVVFDKRVSARWRHFQDTNNNAVRLGASIPLPVFHQKTGNIIAPVALAKTGGERTINKLVLTGIKDTATGAFAENKLLLSSVIPNARSVAETAQLQKPGRFKWPQKKQ